ncbi:MAG TPA: M28 family peptidase, partial [Terriglobales bacterium]|nr:M28 family peptidase [Terriglobales bacterium]
MKAFASSMLSLLLLTAGLGCGQNKTAAAADAQASAASSPAPASPATSSAPVGPALHIDSNRAWLYVKEIIAFGPRWDGSKGQQKMGDYLHAKLKNDHVEDDAFVADTPAGKVPMRNIVAKFPGTKDGIIVLGSHIDTNYPLRNTNFIGANDGGSSTALLLAIADQLRGKKLEGYSVWLAFLDGEESIPSDKPGDLKWVDDYALFGSRHLSEKWQQDGTIKKIKAFLLADMIGDKDLDVWRDANSTPWLEDLVYEAAQRLGYQSYFFSVNSRVGDDHMSFARFG